MATKLGQMATELARTNPWWRDPSGWAATDPDLRPVTATALGYRTPCLDNLAPGALHLLRGPRRVGKTVAVKQAIEGLLAAGTAPNAIVRVAADGWSANDLRTVVQNAALPPVPMGQPRWWFLDEVTAVTGDWATQVKWLRDNDPDFAVATVVLTGSSADKLTAASGVFAGRRRGRSADTDRTLLPMGFASFARLLDSTLPSLGRVALSALRDVETERLYRQLIPWSDVLTRLWEVYLRYGGFPTSVAAAAAGEPEQQTFIDDLFDVIFRDAFAVSQLSTSTTTALFERVMTSMASPLNMNNIATDLSLSPETVRRHVGYLTDAYLVWRCPHWAEPMWKARERAQDKIYAVDPLIARVAHLRNPSRADVDPTVLTEMQLGMAIQRSAYLSGALWADEEFLFYTRTATRKEIDFISEKLAGVALEGKYTDGGKWAREAATVNASRWRGILASRSVLDTTSKDGAWAVPAAFLTYLLDS